MMKWNNAVLPLITWVSLFFSPGCQKEETTPQVSVDEALKTYFDRFELEGQKRGLEIDLRTARISGQLTDIEKENVAGQCQHFENAPQVVLIDRTFWARYSDLQKEYLIFHELGHCYLQRSHLEDKNPDGSCVSIMQSGESGCRMLYNAATRSGYLDELFGFP